LLVVGFAAVGLVLGRNQWPQWVPPIHSTTFPAEPFAASLFYIAFAFSGWNSAVYAAEEFRHPQRDVPRAMLIGTAAVGILYLVVNWIFVANLSPVEASIVSEYEAKRVTLGHLVAKGLIGAGAANIMSVVIILLFGSAISAMTFVGPRIYAAMAADGFLPRVFAGSGGKPPVASVLLQNSLAVAIVLTHNLRQMLENVGAILTLFAALTALSLFKVRLRRLSPKPSILSLTAAGLYTLSAAWMLYFGFKSSMNLLGWIAAVVIVALTAYAITVVLQRRKLVQ
jgi:APA family basic amino acid/polyamine antiporter